MNWKNININKQNVETEKGKAVLIKMPHNSEYDGYKFWHPSKLVRDGRNSNAVSLGYTDSFEFKLFKNGNGKYNKFEKLDEQTITVEEFENAFKVTDENISSKWIDKISTFDNFTFFAMTTELQKHYVKSKKEVVLMDLIFNFVKT